ncbi:MAG: mechanosensitive ion channel [Capnocytophaga sp.]|nr:mechanosensitive ion channel [Capnocytophaga sp.]
MEKEVFSFADFKELIKILIQKTENFIPNLIGAMLLLFIGVWLTRFLRKFIKKLMIRKEVDVTIQNFVNELLRWILYIMLFLAVVQKLGVPISSFLGALTAAGVAVGLALQGSLSNFAGGIMLLILKPFKIGDSIETKGHSGTVKRIGTFYTTLIKYSNEEVMIPNGPLFSDSIVNFSKESNRRLRVNVNISYDSDIQKVKEILNNVALQCPKILKNNPPVVLVDELANNSIKMSVRVWVKNSDYTEVNSYISENIKNELDKAQLKIAIYNKE